jgi:hypothetical protein
MREYVGKTLLDEGVRLHSLSSTSDVTFVLNGSASCALCSFSLIAGLTNFFGLVAMSFSLKLL